MNSFVKFISFEKKFSKSEQNHDFRSILSSEKSEKKPEIFRKKLPQIDIKFDTILKDASFIDNCNEIIKHFWIGKLMS